MTLVGICRDELGKIMSHLLFSLFILALIPLTQAQSRGTWFWGSTNIPHPSGTGETTSPWGSHYVVGNCSREMSTVNFLKARKVDRIYGSYGNTSTSNPSNLQSGKMTPSAMFAERFLMTSSPPIKPSGYS